MADKNKNRSTWAVGAGLLAGLGVGLFFLEKSALYFLGCMFVGLGIGLLVAAVIPVVKGGDAPR